MSIDLERSMDELARSVHDDALAERMNGQVHRMVAQIKRRRAARYTGTSVIGMSAAAAVVVGGMQLAERDHRVAPPATEGPDQGAWPACGSSDVPDPTVVPDATFVLTGTAGPKVAYGADVPVALTLMSLNAQTYTVAPAVQVAVLADGVVVGTAEGDAATLGVEDGVDPAADAAVTVISCGGDTPLDGGDYEMVATVRLTLNDGTNRLVNSDRLPFTIDANPLDAGAAGLAAVDDIVSGAAERADEFGVCGSVVPPLVDAPVTLDIRVEDRVYRAGESISTAVLIGTSDALPDGAQLFANGPRVVLARDGVVVARGEAPSDPVLLDVAADGTTVVVAQGLFALCSLPGADAPSETPLPAGTYQAYAVFTLTVDVTGLPGVDQIQWDPVIVRSEPMDVTIG